MSLPSTIDFAAGDRDYVEKLDALIADVNALYAAVMANTDGALFSATSATSWTVANGSKQFTLVESTQRAFNVGQAVRVAYGTSPQYYGEGQVTAYDVANKLLTVNITTNNTDSAAHTNWVITIVAGATAITSLGVGTAAASTFIMTNAAGNAIVGQAGPIDGFGDIAFWMGTL